MDPEPGPGHDRSTDDAWLAQLLGAPRKIAMVGASPNPERDAHRVFVFLRDHGHDVVPVNPVADEVAGTPTVPDLAGAVARFGGPPDIVDVFRAPEHLPGIVEDVIACKAPTLWLQFGVVHAPSIERAMAAGLDVVVDRCIKVEIGRLRL